MSSSTTYSHVAGTGKTVSDLIRDSTTLRQEKNPTAWYLNLEGDNLALENKYEPNQRVTAQWLHILGINLWSGIPTEDHMNNPFLVGKKFIDEFTHSEVVTVKEGIMKDFQKNVEIFATEHLHTHKEARFIIEGSGYEDVRSIDDRYIRIFLKPGDLIILPAGIYHRFVLDEGKYIKASLWYQQNTSRIQFPRDPNITDAMECREDYMLEVRATKQVFIDEA